MKYGVSTFFVLPDIDVRLDNISHKCMNMLFLEGLCEELTLHWCTSRLFLHCHRESEVEHFGKFIHSMKEGVAKIRSKFIDHCNQMSGREYMYMYIHAAHVHCNTALCTCTYIYICTCLEFGIIL